MSLTPEQQSYNQMSDVIHSLAWERDDLREENQRLRAEKEMWHNLPSIQELIRLEDENKHLRNLLKRAVERIPGTKMIDTFMRDVHAVLGE